LLKWTKETHSIDVTSVNFEKIYELKLTKVLLYLANYLRFAKKATIRNRVEQFFNLAGVREKKAFKELC